MRAKALINGLGMLDLLRGRGVARFGELQASAGVSAPTASAILQELCRANYVRKCSDGYELGTQFLTMSAAVLERFDLRDYAHDELVALRDLSSETAELAVPDGREVLFVDRCASPQHIRLRAQIGYRTPLLHGFAVGKLRLAYMSDRERSRYYRCMERVSELLPAAEKHESDEVRAVFAQVVRELPESKNGLFLSGGRLPVVARCTLQSVDTLEQQLPGIRAAKVCVDVEEGRDGVLRVASPILDHTGACVGIMSVACLTFRTQETKIGMLRDEVRAGAGRVSGAIGYTGDW